MDATTLQPIERLAARICSLTDVDAATAMLVAQGKSPIAAGYELARLCSPGGQADRLATMLDDPETAKRYVQKIAATFAPFADILLAIEVTGDGETWTRTCHGYAKEMVEEAERREARRDEKRKRREARAIATPEEAAERLNVKRAVVSEYARKGKLVGVYRDGKRNPYGVTRQSLEAYAEKQEMRRAATLAKAQAKADRRAEKKELGGIYYTEDGRKVHGAERVSRDEACATFGRSPAQVTAWANAGKIERVYVDPNHRHPVGYLRETVERYAAEREIAAAAGGTYYTAAGKIVGAERISRSEAAQLLDFKELTVTAICRRGEIAHVYADPACTIPCGYTRASVEAWAQAHPRHIPARKAQAIPDFMIAPLPPPPRNHGLRAARLDPATTGEAAWETPAAVIEGEATRTQRRRKPTVVFMLAAWNAATTSEEKERNMENETNEKPAEAATPTAPGKLEIAKAYTIHQAGVIRAICVSEADRDEIVEALRLYRRARAKPGEVESALQLLRAAREIVGTSATAEPEAPDATPAAVAN